MNLLLALDAEEMDDLYRHFLVDDMPEVKWFTFGPTATFSEIEKALVSPLWGCEIFVFDACSDRLSFE